MEKEKNKKKINNEEFYGKTEENDNLNNEDKKKKRIVLVLFILVLIMFILVILKLIFSPNIILNGKVKTILNYKDKYKESGVVASYLGKDITADVTTTGQVNSNKLGVYKIKYSVKKGMFTKVVYRTVIVKDIEKPKIELEQGKNVMVCPADEYKELGYKATDNYDGDITKKVKVTQDKATNKYIYEVIDSSNNKARVTRTVTKGDKEAPKITLKGGDKVYSIVGETFSDPGVEVTDNCDKDIASKVKISNGMDSNKVGVYKVSYIVTDEAGNKTEVTREVEVVEGGKNGTIYLTFDDGPKEGTTDVILDILKQYGVKATFFVINTGPDSLIKREFDEGHTVALHSATHDYATVYSSVDNYFQDLNTISDRVQRITGNKAMLIRFPGGSSNTVSRRYSSGIMSTLTNEVHNRGYKYYDWNISSGDAGGVSTADGVYNTVVSQLSKDRVNMVLCHDIKPYTRDALARIIEYGKQNGYTFAKITEGTEEIHQHVNN